MRATKAIIHLDRLRTNIKIVREHLRKGTALCMPVKADAYGHGAVRIAEEAVRCGVDYLAVATVDEGLELRGAGIKHPVLLFSQPLKEELAEAVKARLIPFIGDAEAAEFFAAAAASAGGERLPVFLKIDTGMGRMGCTPKDAPALAAFIAGQPSLKYAGTATHFAVSDSADLQDVEYTHLQISRFTAALDGIRANGISPGIVTAANTGATLSYPEAWFDMARPGILLYGYPPPAPQGGKPPLAVKPVMELESAVVVIKRVKRGESVSYGRTWTAERDAYIGILPLGYGDGLPRSLSGRFSVIINGNSYPLIGRVCMDQCMVDLGSSPDVERFSTVSVFGGETAGAADAAELARLAGTIPYEICCGITKRVPRVYKG
ncbi:MAG: alanine racemase [Spirochaetaceae bacterium]|jgi:alanine racemase|nr:alanine racemase [Spirochaetaceae bacterium]